MIPLSPPQNSKQLTQKLQELLRDFGKINSNPNSAFLFIIKNTLESTCPWKDATHKTVSQTNKLFGINLVKNAETMQDRKKT